MNGLTEYVRLDKGRLQSLLQEGVLDWTVYNMLTEAKVDYEETDDF